MCLRDFCYGVQDSWLFSAPSCEAPYIAVTLQNKKKKKKKQDSQIIIVLL